MHITPFSGHFHPDALISFIVRFHWSDGDLCAISKNDCFVNVMYIRSVNIYNKNSTRARSIDLNSEL